MPEIIKTRLGDHLVHRGLISHDQLRIALTEQSRSALPLGRQLVQLGFIAESVLRDIIADSADAQAIDLSTVVAHPEALKLVPEDFARRHRMLPLAFDSAAQSLAVAMADIFNIIALDQLRALVGGHIRITTALAAEAQIEEHIDRFYGYALSVDHILGEIESGSFEQSTQPVIRLVNALLMDAVKQGASDIHFEPEQAFLRIRYRIDGVLRQIRSLHSTYWPAIAVRLKVMGGMDIAETRAPQDGRTSIPLAGRMIDFRIASHPTQHGENIVLRVLDREKSVIPLEHMGLRPAMLALLKQLIARPEGMIIITGPTGSGKTTSLYSILAMLNDESVNIMTLEDPIEYPVPLMRQTSMTDAHKLDFVSGIRSILRQDPDIILVGEMRDKETADMAFRAAMTGHQVFTTLHTNSAIGAFSRLLDLGISPEIMTGNIIGIIAQRLVRKLCPHCKTPHEPTAEETGILGEISADVCIYTAAGCEHCHSTGYRGRMAIMELLRIDPWLDGLISRRAHRDELLEAAMTNGYQLLLQDGLHHVTEGQTSLAEIARVLDLSGIGRGQSHA